MSDGKIMNTRRSLPYFTTTSIAIGSMSFILGTAQQCTCSGVPHLKLHHDNVFIFVLYTYTVQPVVPMRDCPFRLLCVASYHIHLVLPSLSIHNNISAELIIRYTRGRFLLPYPIHPICPIRIRAIHTVRPIHAEIPINPVHRF
jgi:hypothetical protein